MVIAERSSLIRCDAMLRKGRVIVCAPHSSQYMTGSSNSTRKHASVNISLQVSGNAFCKSGSNPAWQESSWNRWNAPYAHAVSSVCMATGCYELFGISSARAVDSTGVPCTAIRSRYSCKLKYFFIQYRLKYRTGF